MKLPKSTHTIYRKFQEPSFIVSAIHKLDNILNAENIEKVFTLIGRLILLFVMIAIIIAIVVGIIAIAVYAGAIATSIIIG